MPRRIFYFLIAAGAALAVFANDAVSNYDSEILTWRADRAAALKAENGWLSLAGLFWLHEGANPFGKDPSNEIALPDGPAHAGVFQFHNGKVTLAGKQLAHDTADPSLKAGRVNLYLIKRSDKYGIRVKDPESEARRNFHGLDYYPVNAEYRFVARWVAEPREFPILNMLGQTEPQPSPGYAVFRLHGQEYKLRPYLEEPDAKQLFYVFRDLTAGKETYGAGRFFYTDFPKDGKVILDFNKAYNPPCAFTPYATCPLPPAENKLPLRIEAGEKKYGDH